MAPKNKGKKGKKQDDDDYWAEAGESVAGNNLTEAAAGGDAEPAPATPAPPAVSAEKENDDGGASPAGGKADKKKKKKAVKREDEPQLASLALPADITEKEDDDGGAVPTGGKADKKRKAVKKEDEPAVATPAPPAASAEKEDDDDGAAPAGGKADKKKKKKKAVKKEDEPAPAPAKKKGTGIGALKALMEEKKRLEEEARMREEEERRKIEEEERRIEEEARRKEEEKVRKKEKEKAKRELAKKEGRYLTAKQKEEQRRAELRKQALLASGVQIEGLQQGGEVDRSKKVVYASRKKKLGVKTKEDDDISSTQALTPELQSPAVKSEELPASEPPSTVASPTVDVKNDWDAETKPEKSAIPTPADDLKSDWDASSSDEDKRPKPSKPAAKTTAKANGVIAPTKAPAPTSSKASAPKAPAQAKTSAPSAPTQKAASKDESEESESESEEDSSEENSDDDESSSDEEMTNAQRLAMQRKAEAAERRAKAHEEALAARSKDNLRSPICCILGHVDTGKTKLLDKIRQTNVQEGEAGGITQQIGATYFPVDAIKTKTAVLNKDGSQEYNIPGLLVIDTPGHESFSNLRTRGSSLCNIAILVVDIMHGLEPQTLESLRLLRDKKTPFIVALNKIDRLYGWKATPDGAFRESLAKQKPAVQREFADRLQKTIVAFAEQGLNSVLYYENKSFARNVSLVPTSAITGEGVPDMIMLLVNLTQQRMSDRLMYLSELECTVLEVKVIEGLGTTIDVVLSNGILHEGDRIVVCGLNGPIVTQIRALLTPQPLRELRIKSQYVHHKEVKAALGVKIAAPDLEKAIAGSRLLVIGPDDDEDELRDEVMGDLTTLLNSVDKSGRGVCVQASTLGSLEALLDFLKVSKIPVSGISIGPVHKKDVMRCATVLEKAKELACILCFDVPVDKDTERLADELGIKLFKADIIYHLFDAFTEYNREIMEAKRKDAAPQAVWPCRLKTIACFAKRDPIILGVDILDGSLRVGTPLCVVKVDPVTQKKEIIDLGKITSLEINHKSMDVVKKSQAGGGVAVKIEHAVYQTAKMFGRHFEEKDEIISHITRASIDILKSTFKADVTTEEWLLIKNLKPRLGIQ